MSVTFRRFGIAAGTVFFKYRNLLFPVVLVLLLLTVRPSVMLHHPGLDQFLGRGGFVVALVGELVRIATIGFDYIDRGGKRKQVSASRLVHRGMYGLTRNPMYVGNLMIVTGVVMVSGAPLAYLTVIPFFLFVYHAIILAEEEFLRTKFGPEYEAYCASVPRFFPSCRGAGRAFTDMQFNFRRPFKQDLSTITWVALVLTAMPIWRTSLLQGWAATRPLAWRTAWAELGILTLYGLLVLLKKGKSPLFYTAVERAQARALRNSKEATRDGKDL